MAHVSRLQKRLLDGITSKVENTVINGDEKSRYPGNLNISFAFVEVVVVPGFLSCCGAHFFSKSVP